MSIPTDAQAFYTALVERNQGLISAQLQERLRGTRIVIAGCGSTGGACAMPLLRTGAERFLLLDPGEYDLNNLNRQDANLDDVGRNKAEVTARRMKAVNPHAEIEIDPAGVRADAIESQLVPGDMVIDAVDVTTAAGVEAKIALHAACVTHHLVVITAYDIAATQFIEVFDYHHTSRPLNGRVRPPLTPENVLRSLIPPRALPREIFSELIANRKGERDGFPQLAMTSTLFGALVVSLVLRLLDGQPVRRRIKVDLYDLVRPPVRRSLERVRRDLALPGLWAKLRG